jgi:hypothetical protein
MTTTVVELLRASRCYSPASAQLTENKGGGKYPGGALFYTFTSLIWRTCYM